MGRLPVRAGRPVGERGGGDRTGALPGPPLFGELPSLYPAAGLCQKAPRAAVIPSGRGEGCVHDGYLDRDDWSTFANAGQQLLHMQGRTKPQESHRIEAMDEQHIRNMN